MNRTAKLPVFICVLALVSLVSDQTVSATETLDADTHIVRKGETLFAIAREHRIAVEAIQAENHLGSDVIKPGQDLVIPDRFQYDKLDQTRPGSKVVFTIGEMTALTMVYVPGGSFTRGCSHAESEASEDFDDHPPRQVTISHGYWLAQTECAQRQWMALMKKNPSHFKGPLLPVESVSVEDVQEFCRALNESLRPFGKWRFELPMCAEWEKACRAGTRTAFYFGDALNGTLANCDGAKPFGTSRKGPSRAKTVNVASYAPNAYGLFDMHGNVWELTSDWMGVKAETDDVDPISRNGTLLALRGGAYDSRAADCRSATESVWHDADETGDPGIGFRVALVWSR